MAAYKLCVYMLSCCCVWLFCNPMDCSPPGSSFHEISQARTLEWVAMPSSRGSSQPRDQTPVFCVSCIHRQILYYCTTWEDYIQAHSFAINKIITAIKQAILYPFCKYTSFVTEITCRWMFNVALISFNIKFFFEYFLNSLMWFTI